MSEAYKASGVDVEAGYEAVRLMRAHVAKTRTPGVISDLGGFGGLFELGKGYENPVLVSGTDGVGTKLMLAFILDKHDTVGQDCVAMCANDVACAGAKPLFFLDYLAVGKNVPQRVAEIVSGVAKGCVQAGAALIGGETAEMPGMYPAGEYDLAGFAVGAVEKSRILTGQSVRAGDVVLGLASSGVHSNGFSLVRKCIERAAGQLPRALDGQPFRQAVMAPTRIYVKSLLAALNQHHGAIRALAHITGGGLTENIPRVLPAHLAAHLTRASWPQSELFAWLAQTAGIGDAEMNRTFNNGIGMVAVCAPEAFDAVAATLRAHDETLYRIGIITERGAGNAVVVA